MSARRPPFPLAGGPHQETGQSSQLRQSGSVQRKKKACACAQDNLMAAVLSTFADAIWAALISHHFSQSRSAEAVAAGAREVAQSGSLDKCSPSATAACRIDHPSGALTHCVWQGCKEIKLVPAQCFRSNEMSSYAC